MYVWDGSLSSLNPLIRVYGHTVCRVRTGVWCIPERTVSATNVLLLVHTYIHTYRRRYKYIYTYTWDIRTYIYTQYRYIRTYIERYGIIPTCRYVHRYRINIDILSYLYTYMQYLNISIYWITINEKRSLKLFSFLDDYKLCPGSSVCMYVFNRMYTVVGRYLCWWWWWWWLTRLSAGIVEYLCCSHAHTAVAVIDMTWMCEWMLRGF